MNHPFFSSTRLFCGVIQSYQLKQHSNLLGLMGFMDSSVFAQHGAIMVSTTRTKIHFFAAYYLKCFICCSLSETTGVLLP